MTEPLKPNQISVGDVFCDTNPLKLLMENVSPMKYVVIAKEAVAYENEEKKGVYSAITVLAVKHGPQPITVDVKVNSSNYTKLFIEKNRIFDAENVRWCYGE